MNNQLVSVPEIPHSTEGCGIYHFFQSIAVFRGGGERARTDGLLRARQALSQLSYTPNK